MRNIEIPLGGDLVADVNVYVLWVGAVLLVSLYFLPTVVAIARKHRNRLAIIVLNLVAGWTFVGWVVALVWSCTKDARLVPSAASEVRSSG